MAKASTPNRMRNVGGYGPRFRHIPFAYSNGAGFGDHYINQDESPSRIAGQFTVTVYPRGDVNLPAGDRFRTTPHVQTRVWDGSEWAVTGKASIETPIP